MQFYKVIGIHFLIEWLWSARGAEMCSVSIGLLGGRDASRLRSLCQRPLLEFKERYP